MAQLIPEQEILSAVRDDRTRKITLILKVVVNASGDRNKQALEGRDGYTYTHEKMTFLPPFSATVCVWSARMMLREFGRQVHEGVVDCFQFEGRSFPAAQVQAGFVEIKVNLIEG
jgi:hypothetical protein